MIIPMYNEIKHIKDRNVDTLECPDHEITQRVYLPNVESLYQ